MVDYFLSLKSKIYKQFKHTNELSYNTQINYQINKQTTNSEPPDITAVLTDLRLFYICNIKYVNMLCGVHEQ